VTAGSRVIVLIPGEDVRVGGASMYLYVPLVWELCPARGAYSSDSRSRVLLRIQMSPHRISKVVSLIYSSGLT